MGYFLESGRSYEGARRGLQPSGRRPVRDLEEEKRQARIEATYATRPRTLARALRMRDSGLVREIAGQEDVPGENQSVRFDPERGILGAGDFAITFKTEWTSESAALKVFLPATRVWEGLSENLSGRNKGLQAIADDEWEVLKMRARGVVRGLAIGEVSLTESTTIPLILREYHPHTVSSTAGDIKAHNERDSIMLQAAEQLGLTLDLLRADHGVLVSDITPDNVFVDKERNFLIGDVGGAVRINEERPDLIRGFSFGTPDAMFAPPELYEGIAIPGKEVVTPRAQVYSLAALLHFMAGGQSPDQLDRFLQKEFSDLERLGLPVAMVTSLRKALSRNPQDRYETPGEFARALQAST